MAIESPKTDALLVVRSSVASCLLEREKAVNGGQVFIDSVSLCKYIQMFLSGEEKAALVEVGGGDSTQHFTAAVETALLSLKDDNGVKLEHFHCEGRPTWFVIGIDRAKLVKELPHSPLKVHDLSIPPLVINSLEQQLEAAGEYEKTRPRGKFLGKDTCIRKRNPIPRPRRSEFCSALTLEDCLRNSGSSAACSKVHLKRIIAPHTDINSGDCPFLDACFNKPTCKYIHYELIDWVPFLPEPTTVESPMKALSVK